MFNRHYRFVASAWMLLFVVLAFASGCSSDGDKTPFDPGPGDQAPPLTPTGIGLASQSVSKFMLNWVPNVDPDLAGYRVYLYDPSPSRSNAFACLTGTELWRSTSFPYAGTDGTTYSFRVTAVDTSGNESAMSDPMTFSFSVTGNSDATAAGHTNQTGRGTAETGGFHGWLPNDHTERETNR
jgi:hypothetical protein